MRRRGFLEYSTFAAAAAGINAVMGGTARAEDAPAHDHQAMMAAAADPAAVRKYDAIIGPLQTCTAAVQVCIAHCQLLLAAGDKSMGACLRTALDCDVTCGAALKAAGLNSGYTPALSKTAVAAMEACVKACKPHVDHHPQCKACHDACLGAIKAINALG